MRISRRHALTGLAWGAGTLAGAAASFTRVAGAATRAAAAPLTVAGLPVELAVTPVTPRTVRLVVRPVPLAGAAAEFDDGALVIDWRGAPPAYAGPARAALRLRAVAGTRSIACGELRVRVTAAPFTLRVETRGGALVQELFPDAEGAFGFSLGEGPVFGLGQGGPQFNRRGTVNRMGSGEGAYRLATNGAEVPIQFLLSDGWALFIHQPLGAFDLTGPIGRLSVREGRRGGMTGRGPGPGSARPPASASLRPPLPLDVFVTGVATPAEAMREYATLTGFAVMPPLWSLGYQQSHRTLGAPAEIIEEARTFRQKHLPCDAMIYLGTDFCPEGWNTHNGEFTWNPAAFPDPPAALAALHDQHFKVVLHVVLEGRRLTGTVHDPCTAAPLPSGRTPDGHWPPDRQVSCYWPAHKPLFDLGVDGWWPDQGDGLDAASRLARNRMYFEGSQQYRPNQRVYALNRNGYAGMQRYASFLWSGDVASTWTTLKTHIAIGINAGLSGIPYWGTDIGGFVPTREYTGELYARWFQFGAFCPLFRSHGRDWRLHLPWGWNTGTIGVPETRGYHPDPAELHNPAIEPVCKRYLELRYRLLPYIYAAVRETCDTGLPILRGLWLHYSDDPAAAARDDEFLFGRDLLVAPVCEPAAATRTLYLPRGAWVDFWTGERLAGGREITRPVDLATLPLYVRAGAVLPLAPLRQYTAEPVAGPITLRLHPGADGAGTLYEDDGATFDYERGAFTRIACTWDDARRRLRLRLAPGSKLLPPAPRHFEIQLAGRAATRPITFDGHPLELHLDD